MDFFKKLFGRPSRKTPSSSGPQRSSEAELNSAAQTLYRLWKTTAFDLLLKDTTSPDQQIKYDTLSDSQCVCGSRATLTEIEGGVMCPRCNRRIMFGDFVRSDKGYQKGIFRHRGVVEIGDALYKQGGHEAMQQAAYRFAALGGRTSDLSRTWHGTGEWMH